MRQESLALGITKDTNEIRESYDLITFKSNLSYMPANESQVPHKHFLVREAVHVLDGQIEVWHEDTWKTVVEKQVALFDLNELHNVRTGNLDRPLLFPGTANNTAAVAIVYKWIPPYLEIYEDEVSFVIKNDWFNYQYEDDLSDPKTSPLLRLEKSLQGRFWEIVKRNKVHPPQYHNGYKST